MSVIEIKNITKDYGDHKGVFDVSFGVEQGEVLGFLGPNGAGKTTTIRQLMGFIKPDQGEVSINGLHCFKEAAKIQGNIGYLSGEIAFMDDMNGYEFIHFIGKMKGMKDFHRANELIEMFEFNPKGKIKKMSKGMKQKLGIVCAFMQNADILILDEPTSGLDPLMQNKFVTLILNEKENGKTILMSSHLFEEVEKTCDRCAIIKDGKIVAIENMKDLKQNKRKIFEITFAQEEEANMFVAQNRDGEIEGRSVIVHREGNFNSFLKILSDYEIEDLNVRSQTIEELFVHFYGGNQHE